jgi:hypothetical protein
MVLAGVFVLAGGAGTALISGLAAAAGGALWLRRVLRARSARWGGDRAAAGGEATAAQLSLAGWLDRSPAPVTLLPISVLGSEWSRTTAALTHRLQPAARQAVVRRRQEILDELERRDPASFAHWLAAGAATDSDPASFLRDGRAPGTDAA